MRKITGFLSVFLFLCFLIPGIAFSQEKSLMMATTTSTDNTGLLDFLAPQFKKDTGIELFWTAVGTGKALRMGQNCDVDILLVHAPAAEKKYIDSGYGIDRKEVMYNDFIIVGPKSDPAKIKGLNSKSALEKISKSKAVFVSRGDDSGTNKKEIGIWKNSGVQLPDKESWYVQTGQGMLSTLNVAAEKEGYTLTDRGTYIKYMDQKKKDLTLFVVVEGDDILKNQYSTIIVNPANCSHVKKAYAQEFQNWIGSEKIQKMIRDFRLLGQPLFIPNAK